MNRATSIISKLCMLLVAVSLFACERSVESLEDWRNAEGGFEKLSEWAASDEEPMPVRVRAMQILLEEGQVNQFQPLLESVKSPETQHALVAGVMPTVQTMWDAQDQPSLSEEDKKKGGRIQVANSQTVMAKDAAFFLQPHASDADKAKLEGMLAKWMEKDQDLRTQLGNVTLGQIAPRAGKAGTESLKAWIESTNKPANVQRTILKAADTPEVRAAIGEVLAKRAKEKHPDLNSEFEYAVLENNSEPIAEYLEFAINDEATSAKMKDGFMDALVRAKGAKATPFFAELVTKEKGLMRWVSAQRIVELRGKTGILVAAKALPIEHEAYEGEDLQKEMEITCNFISTEMPKLDVDNIDNELKQGLKSDRWPAQVLALKCAEIGKSAGVKADVEALKSSKTAIPNWGEDDKMTIGKLAEEVAGKL